VYENGQLAGVLPLRRFRGALSSTTNSDTPQFGFLSANEAVMAQLSLALFSQKARRIDLSFLSPADSGVSLTRATADATHYRLHADSVQAAPHIATDGDWDEYQSGLDKSFKGFRHQVRRRRRRLEEEGQVALEVYDGTERLDALLEEGFGVEESSWKGTYGTSINSHLATKRFYTEVAHWAAERGWLRLAFLRLDGRPLAFEYCLEYDRTHYSLKIGYDPAYGKFGPGNMLKYLMIARAFSEEEIDAYDFSGVGSYYAWKREWTTTQQEALFLHMFAPTALGFVDQAIFLSSRSAFEGAKRLARSSVVGERGHRLLKRVHATTSAKLSRR
jgi:CelD/BcsL family acetyltransferase involved in cellulose biosynthesis